MLKTVILLMSLGYAIRSSWVDPRLHLPGKPCNDSDGIKHEHGEEYEVRDCYYCQCIDGDLVCGPVDCHEPHYPFNFVCKVRPGTEDQCCPAYDCEPLRRRRRHLCYDSDGNKHNAGQSWKEEKCMECHCGPSSKTCHPRKCVGPPEGKECSVEPGTENDCCPQYRCLDATFMCDETHHVNDSWVENCMDCFCDDQLWVIRSAHKCAPRPPLPDLCHWAKRTPDECCPTKRVCEKRISDCPVSSVAPSCPDSICDHCPDHPDAECRISRCGGCSAKFYENDVLVKCDGGPVEMEPNCPSVPVNNCLVSPCEPGSCDPHPNAICRVNYCNQCEAVFYDDNNEELDCRPLKGK